MHISDWAPTLIAMSDKNNGKNISDHGLGNINGID